MNKKLKWIRGYDQQYRHLIIKVDPASRYTRTYFACGMTTDYVLDCIYDLEQAIKCPFCLEYEKNNFNR